MGNCRNKSESWLSTAWDLPSWIQDMGWPYGTHSPMGPEAGAICCLLLLCPICLPKNKSRFLEDKALQDPLILILGLGFFSPFKFAVSRGFSCFLDLKVMKERKQTQDSTSSHSESLSVHCNPAPSNPPASVSCTHTLTCSSPTLIIQLELSMG